MEQNLFIGNCKTMKKRKTIPHDAVEALKELETLNQRMRELKEQREVARCKGDEQTVRSLIEQERSLFIEEVVPLRKSFHHKMEDSAGRCTDAMSLPAAACLIRRNGRC